MNVNGQKLSHLTLWLSHIHSKWCSIYSEICMVTKTNDMKKYMITSLLVAIIMTVVASCQPAQKESEKAPIALKDTIVSPNIKVESGYADVNGLKMYYEVHQPTT